MAFRAQLLEMARTYTRDRLGLTCTAPAGVETVIATGHQPVWHHCGIWIKSLVCGRLARALGGGACLHIVLDHDIRPTTLAVPRRRGDGLWQVGHLDLAAGRQEVPLECRHAETEGMSRFVERVIQTHDEQFCNRIWRRQGPTDEGRPVTVADAITRLQAALYAACGLDNMMYLPVSRLSASEAFGDFVASVLSNPIRFSQSYNHAVTEQVYDRSGGIRPLAADHRGGGTELPFWLVRPDGRRTSLHVRMRNEVVVLMAGIRGEVGRLRAGAILDNPRGISRVLEETGWAIRPKAVALTSFARLYLCDWFIHGLGGMRYEGVTDYLLREYHRVPVSAYGVVTCTAILPWCRSRPDWVEGALPQSCPHHLRHNPEERFGEPQRWPERVKSLVERKRREIALAGNRESPADRRKMAWKSILAINRQLRDCAEGHPQSCEQRSAQPGELRASRAIGSSREYFFGLFPGSELVKLAASATVTCPGDVPEQGRDIRSIHPRVRTEI